MDSFCGESNWGCAIFLSVIIGHNVNRLFSVVLGTASWRGEMRPESKAFWRTAGGALCLAGGVLAIQPSQAAEYGWGNYLLGYSIPMSGYTPPPGVYFTDAFFYYRGSAGNSVTFPRGRIVAAGVTEKFAVDSATLAWFTNVDVIGATFGLGITRISLRRSSAA
jgi:hypothetical protein